ncbi:MAG: ABC transporter ATP-binding protein [Bacteroidota bacterium]
MAKKKGIFSASGKSQRYGGELSFKDNLEALQFIPPFLKMIWETHKGFSITNIILRVVQAGIPVTVLYVGKLIIDEVIRLSEVGADADKTYLWTIIGIELGLAVFTAILSRGISLVDALLGDLFANKTSVSLMKHAASLDLPQFEDATFFDKLERARRQTTNRVMLMSQFLTQIQDFITILFLALGLVAFNPWLILILIIAVIPSFINETHFNQRGYSLARSWTPQRRELDYLRYIGASNETAKEVKIFGLANFISDRFADVADNYYQANKKLAIQRAGWGTFFGSLGDLGYYAAYVVIVLQAISGEISIGDLTFLAGSFSRLRGLLRGVLSRFSVIAQSALYLKDFFDFMEITPEINTPSNPIILPNPIRDGFIFENVSFKYPSKEEYAIKDVSFHLHAGEKLALVGENGAGKTTLVKLIARLYDPSEGRILLDGQDLKNYSLEELRKAISVIFQDYVRFQMTAAENIAVGNIWKKEERPIIEYAAEKSLANQVITRLDKGFDQLLGRRFEGGVDLSGGEWQKVALGRAYMRDAQLLILDEPTAALDARAEYEVFQRFSDLTKGKTAVLISHRFSTVRMADRILVLEKGHKLELGSHEELLALDGTYAELFNLQAQGYQ